MFGTSVLLDISSTQNPCRRDSSEQLPLSGAHGADSLDESGLFGKFDSRHLDANALIVDVSRWHGSLEP